jgi:hypothetical protein
MSPPRQRTQDFPCSPTRLHSRRPTQTHRRFVALCNHPRMLNVPCCRAASGARAGAALRSGRLALGEFRARRCKRGTSRESAGTVRAADASHITFRSGRSANLRCSQRTSPGKPADGPGHAATAVATAATAKTPLQITCPRRSPGAAAITAKTHKSGLEITAGRRAFSGTVPVTQSSATSSSTANRVLRKALHDASLPD